MDLSVLQFKRRTGSDAEASAPRNSRELAVRNQFFTPRYVVEFLTDNTLGRIWYEMRKGNTVLKEACQYLVCCPTEIFLSEGQQPPSLADAQERMSKAEILNQPVYVPHRGKRDPRTLKILDPAVGSGHFLLYAFDLLEVIYQEAWKDSAQHIFEGTGKTLCEEYKDLNALRIALPELILRHNLHGIDIDLRACQIAALALWLRAQHSYQCLDLKSSDRPKITSSNIVCAEPMPGEQGLLDQFLTDLQPKVIGQLVQEVFEKMKLAGEAGSLLKIEEEIAGAVAAAKQKWLAGPKPEQGLLFANGAGPQQRELGLDFSGVTDEAFWERTEERIYTALQRYAERADNGHGYQRRLFAFDAARGFAFIDLCRKRYDVALMNPPFGDASLPSKPYIEETYGDTKGDVYKAFVECFQARLVPAGYLGIISSRTGFFLGQSEDWRTRIVLRLFRPIVLADLGMGVLDAMVEVAAYVLRSLSVSEARDLTLSLVPVLEKMVLDAQERFSLPKWQAARHGLKRHQAMAELAQLAAAGLIQRSAGDMVRFSPVWQTVRAASSPRAPVYPPLFCIRALTEDDKATVLGASIRDPASKAIFVCDPGGFSVVPTSPFSYWVPQSFRNLFKQFEPTQGDGRYACVTNPLGENFRFVRTSWEVVPSLVGRDRRWVPFAKGGSYSPYYSDLHLMVDWDNSRGTYRGFVGTSHRPLARPASSNHFFRPGITWPSRADGLSFRLLPAGAIFSGKGPALFYDEDNSEMLLAVCAVLCSPVFKALVAIQLGRVSLAQSYEVGLVQQTPFPKLSPRDREKLADYARQVWTEKYALDCGKLTAHPFVRSSLLASPGATLAERADAWATRVRTSEKTIFEIQRRIDELTFRLYSLNDADPATFATVHETESCERIGATAGEDEDDEAETITADAVALTAELIDYALGIAFGRWDIRFSTGEKQAVRLPEPFAPLPACPCGMLQNERGLPFTKEEVQLLQAAGQWRYPIEIPWDGISVDDPDNTNDIVRRVRDVLVVIWKERAEVIEQEACEILGVRDLREYFRKPGLFFAGHMKRYSKSQRKAPIYWPLSTASGSYTLWIYCHRLNDDFLYTALNKYVKPKIDHTEDQLRRIESELRDATGREARPCGLTLNRRDSFLRNCASFRMNWLGLLDSRISQI